MAVVPVVVVPVGPAAVDPAFVVPTTIVSVVVVPEAVVPAVVVPAVVVRVAEVARELGWLPPKSLDSDENFKPEHTLFCRELRFVAIYALFGDLWAKKCLLGSKRVFLGQEVHHYMVYIAYFTRGE